MMGLRRIGLSIYQRSKVAISEISNIESSSSARAISQRAKDQKGVENLFLTGNTSDEFYELTDVPRDINAIHLATDYLDMARYHAFVSGSKHVKELCMFDGSCASIQREMQAGTSNQIWDRAINAIRWNQSLTPAQRTNWIYVYRQRAREILVDAMLMVWADYYVCNPDSSVDLTVSMWRNVVSKDKNNVYTWPSNEACGSWTKAEFQVMSQHDPFYA